MAGKHAASGLPRAFKAGRLAAVWLLLAAAGCRSSAPSSSYFGSFIQPILTARCSQGGGGLCHSNNGTGRALGNLDLSSFEGVTRRRDVLRRYGSYPLPLLLLKSVPEQGTLIPYGDRLVESQIFHAGGKPIAVGSDAFYELRRWLENGATRDGLPPPPPPGGDRGPCVREVRTDLFSQPMLDAIDTSSEGYRRFQSEVWPILKGGGKDLGPGCLGRECHGVHDTNGVPTVELYLTCGDDELQQRFNYLMARTWIGPGGRSPLTEKPLSGTPFHAGGKLFASQGDGHYQTMRSWAAIEEPLRLTTSEGEGFFRANVQPVLLRRGCYLEACHSLVNFNFYKPLPGADGLFGTRAMLHNYLQARFMLGLESPDPKQGRLLKKNLFRSSGGIPHRGGSLLDPVDPCPLDPGAVRADPSRPWFEEATPGCVIATWHRLERTIAIENGQLGAAPGAVGVFVRRPPDPGRLLDFDSYRPGADLLRLDLARDAQGRLTGLAQPPASLLAGCGVPVAVADVRRPDISGDGAEVIFAMRASASEGLDLWRVGIDGAGCRRLGLAAGSDAGGTPVHHFDPVFGPGGLLVFASTRADADHPDAAHGYSSRTPRWFLPASNIWVLAPGGTPRRLSYLTGAELGPALLHTREVIYAVEKAAPDFYQISTRAVRIDDGGGYRPQLGQRPAMGYGQVAEMRELGDFRTAYIASDPGTFFGGGTLCIQDLSLGLEDLSYQDVGFLHSTRVLDPGAAARRGVPGSGVYRSPAALPDGRILCAYSPGTVDLGDSAAAVDYGLWVVDPTGREAPWRLFDTPGQFDIEPAVAWKRIFVPQPNRIHQGDPLRSEVVFHSVQLFASLLNSNSRRRTVPNAAVASVRVLEQLPPPAGAAAADVAADVRGPMGVYVRRRVVGEAPLLADGSLRILVPSRTPLVFELLDRDGHLVDRQREEEQYGPGETQARIITPSLFNATCGGCHNALDGSELGVAVGPDVVSGASTRSAASRARPADLYTDPAARPLAPADGP